MGLFMQGERVKRLLLLRQAIHRLTETPPAQEQKTGAPQAAQPGWLLLFFDVCCLAGLLVLTLYISWVYDRLPSGDPQLYHAYAFAFWDVQPFFHAFPKEYPPLSLIPFSLTLWPPSTVHFYWVFAMWMGLIVCISYILFARYLSRSRAITYAAYVLVGATGTLLMRYDLLPALATFGALLLAERKHYRWAYGMLAIGVLLKLYPAFLVPVLMVHQWRESAPVLLAHSDDEHWTWRQRLRAFWRAALESISDYRASGGARLRAAARTFWQRGREMLTGVGVFVLVTLMGFLVPAMINYAGTVSEFKYALSRPIQIESVPASLLWLGTFLGFPAQPNESFVSLNLVGPLDGVIRQLSLLALVAGTLLVCWQVLRGRLSLGQGFVAMLAVVLASNKLLSPQYIMWILPLVAYVEGFDLLWLIICALTTLIYPFLYQTRHPILLVPTNPAFLPTIALRNALLVTATALAVMGRRRAVAPASDEAAATPAPGLAEVAHPELLAGRSGAGARATTGSEHAATDGHKPLVKTSQEQR